MRRLLVVEDRFTDKAKENVPEKVDFYTDFAMTYDAAYAMLGTGGYDGLVTDCFIPKGSEDGKRMVVRYFSVCVEEVEGGGCWDFLNRSIMDPNGGGKRPIIWDEEFTGDFTKSNYFAFVRELDEASEGDPLPLGPLLMEMADQTGLPAVLITSRYHHHIEPVMLLASKRGWELKDCMDKGRNEAWKALYRRIAEKMNGADRKP